MQNIPVNWQLAKLNDVAEVILGQSPPSHSYNVEKEGIPFFQGKAEFTNLYPVVKKWCVEPKKISVQGDILLSVRAPVGAVNLSNTKCCIGRGLAAIRYSACNKFLFYYFKLIERKLDEQGTGTTFRAISGDVLKNLQLYLPPVNEQHRIVTKIEELFSELDKGIESLKTAREQLNIYRQSLLKHAFEGKLTEQWRKDNADKLESADDLLARIQKERETRYQQQLDDWKVGVKQWETEGKKGRKPTKPSSNKYFIKTYEEECNASELPIGWKNITLGEIIVDGPTNGYSPKSGNDARGTFSLKLTATTSCKMILNEDATKRLYEVIPNDSKYWLKPGDLLVQRANAIEYLGSTAIYDGEPKKYIYPDLMMRLRFHSDIVTKYIWLYLNGHIARMYFQANASGIAGNMPKISGSVLKLTPIPLQSIEEMEKIVELLDTSLFSISSIEDEIENQVTKSEILRQSILNKAFSGQLASQDPNDEPASVLLERIKVEKAEQDKQNKARKTTKKTLKA